MSPVSEFEGKTVENAIENACEALNIPKEKLKFSIMSHGSSGIFGLVGVRKAKIRVTVPESAPEPAKPKAASPKAASPKPASQKKEKQKSVKEIPKSDMESPKSVSDKEDSDIEEEIAESDTEIAGDDLHDHEPYSSDDDEAAVPVNHAHVSQEMMETCREVLQRIADSITDNAVVSVFKTAEYICFDVAGGNSAVLIGKRGQTLEAIQYIAEKVFNKTTDQRVRVRVDIEGYLNKRKERLETLAKRLAEKVVQTGKPSTIGQMNAHDRRIIHIALRDNTEVRTQSMGEGFYRKLVIFPKKKNARKKPKSPKS